ncbi:hypothetical protein ABZX75_26465 [Streptomyces sp. NPDC003038]|uniref:hypothetical protein n=1 Tax=unclassified Streptomyces TaxID=2593676 RepID=UPI0033B818D0
MMAIRQQQRRTKKQTVGWTGRFAAVAVAAGLSIGTVTAGPSWSAAAEQAGRTPAAAGRGSECAEVRDKVERLEGLITPNACAFMKRQIAFGEMRPARPPRPGIRATRESPRTWTSSTRTPRCGRRAARPSAGTA